MIHLIDCSFDFLPEYTTPEQVFKKRWPGYGYVEFINTLLCLTVIQHINYEGKIMSGNVWYSFFKGRKNFFNIPFGTLIFIKKRKPDVVITQGLIFPVQVILLRLILGSRCRIITQHHGEIPYPGIKKFFQKIADRCTDAYLFTASGNMKPWIECKIIRNPIKGIELLESSTYFKRREKEDAKSMVGMSGNDNFLWVGRLQMNKDPFTVLNAFEKYLSINSLAKLYMIYGDGVLINQIEALIDKNDLLKKRVILVGDTPHDDLTYWYSAADFFISGSRREGSGYALLEAMACGCIPVITDIPSFRKITADGQFGFLYEAGNVNALFSLLQSLKIINRREFSDSVADYFEKELSFQCIAEKMFAICRNLVAK